MLPRMAEAVGGLAATFLWLAAAIRLAIGAEAATVPASALVGARVRVSDAATSPAQLTNALARAREVLARARIREEDRRALPEWARVGALETMIADIANLQRSGDYAKACEMAVSTKFAQARQRVIDEVIEAIPFLVIGPFGNPAWTDTDRPKKSPVFMAAEALKPFVGETDGTNWDTCRKEFRPDPAGSYPGSGRDVRWHRVSKTESLSLDEAAAPYPLWMVAYAYTEIYSPEARDISLSVKTDFGSPPMAWVGGRLVTSPVPAGRPSTTTFAVGPYEGLIHAGLAKGWNPVLFRMPARKGMRFAVTPLKRDPGPDAFRHVYTPMDDLRFRLPGSDSASAPTERTQ